MDALNAHIPSIVSAPVPFVQVVSLNDSDAALLEAFASDVRTAALSCINLLSVFNAIGFSRGSRLPANLDDFAPPPTPSFASVPASGLGRLLAPATRSGIKAFQLFLLASGDAFAAVTALYATKGVVTARDVDLVRDQLSSAAQFAKLTLKDLVLIHRKLFRAKDVTHMRYLVALVDDVLEGKSPLLHGSILVPARTEFQSRERRIRLIAEAMATATNRVQQVTVTNISPSGLGFSSAVGFDVGQVVDIKLLAADRRFRGKVTWRLGMQAGIEFFDSLETSDTLLGEA